jgi:hypothetical protein
MSLTVKRASHLLKNSDGIPVGKIVCIAKAGLKFYCCWKSSGSDQCVRTFIKDIEICLKN